MKKLFLFIFVFFFVSFGCAQNENKTEEKTIKIFDETRDPKQDLTDAINVAQ
jgi:hypothetical protein